MGTSKHTIGVHLKAKDAASKELRNLGDTGKKAGQSIAAGFIKAQLALGAMKVAIRGAVNLVRSLTTDIAASADAMAKYSSRIGISVEALSEFHHVAELSGVATTALEMALQRMVRRVSEAARGTGEAQKAIAELGIDAKALAALAPEDQFMAIAEMLNGVENSADRVRLAMKFFDSEGVKLLQIINQGSDAISAMREDARALGIVMSTKAAKDAEKFNDAIDRMQKSFMGVKIAIASELIPALTEMFDKVTEWVTENRGEIVEWANSAVGHIGEVARAARELGRAIEYIVDSFAALGRTEFSYMAEAVKSGTLRPDALRWTPDQITDVISDESLFHARMKNAGAAIVDGMLDAFKIKTSAFDLYFPPGRGIAPLGTLPGDPQAPGLGQLEGVMAGFGGGGDSTTFADELDASTKNVEATVTMLERFTSGLNTAINRTYEWGDTLEHLGGTIVSSFQSEMIAMVEAIETGTKSISEAFRDMGRQILLSMQRVLMNQITAQFLGMLANLIPGAGGIGSSPTGWQGFSQPWTEFATGGIVTRPTLGMVGEAGPEAIVPLNKAGMLGGTVNVTQNVYPSPGMDESALADLAASRLQERLASSQRSRQFMRGITRGGLM